MKTRMLYETVKLWMSGPLKDCRAIEYRDSALAESTEIRGPSGRYRMIGVRVREVSNERAD
jgi:hypothetical protein